MAVVGSCGGCATERPFVWVQDLPPVHEGELVVGNRDTIVVVVRNQPTLSGEFVVRDDGAYLQPMVGSVAVAGRTPAQIADDLRARLKDMVVNPDISVSRARIAPIRVNVIGEVRTPGSYELARDRGVIPALAAAGWLTEFAGRDRIFVVRSARGERRVRFRTRELTGPDPRAAEFRLRDGDVVVVE
jgi:polysaccharide export outer membrane protein